MEQLEVLNLCAGNKTLTFSMIKENNKTNKHKNRNKRQQKMKT